MRRGCALPRPCLPNAAGKPADNSQGGLAKRNPPCAGALRRLRPRLNPSLWAAPEPAAQMIVAHKIPSRFLDRGSC
jgi:hypothetical protein